MKIDPKMQIFFDIANKLLDSPKTFKDILDIEVDTWNKKTLFIYEDDRGRTIKISYASFKQFAYQYAYAFENEIKEQKGSFIALKMNNSPKWVYSLWGLIIAGFNVILINPITLTNDSNRLIKESGAKAIVSDKDEKLDIPLINVENIKLTEKSKNTVFADKIAFSTSGTTGKSRIFVYNSTNLVYQIYAAYCMPETTKTIMYAKPDIRLITMIPFSHIFGFVANYLWYSFFGRTFVFTKSINPEEIVRITKKYKITHVYSVPLFWDRIAKLCNNAFALESEKKQKIIQKLIAYNNAEISKTEAGFIVTRIAKKKIKNKILGTSLVHCIAGGSALSKDTLRIINGIGYPLYNGYGMTEVGITSVELSPNVIQRNKASVGKPLTNIEYKLENGELLIKSPQIHSETLINGKLEKAIIDENGFFHTGDIAEIDEDGNTYIKGKLKDVVIGPNGENIYPDEIESKFKDIAEIDDLAVFGVNDANSEKLTMAIYIANKLSSDQIKNVQNKIAEANDRLPLSMQVQEFYLSTMPLPTNTSMKIMRYQLIDDLKNRPETFVKLSRGNNVSFDEFDEKDVKENLEHVIDIISDVLNVDKKDIAPSSHVIIDLGGDSFTYMSIIASVESEFNIKIETEMIGRLNTANEFTLYILKNKKIN